jgi:hypothetical protein
MMVNEATQVEELLIRKLQHAHLAKLMLLDKSQFLDMEDYVFMEVVLTDGAELDRVETIVRDLTQNLGARGIKVDSIVRAVWEVTDVQDNGTAHGADGAPRAAREFRVTLKSGNRLQNVIVDVSWGGMEFLAHKLGLSRGRTDYQSRLTEEMVKTSRKFVVHELTRGGTSYWNPIKYSHLELNDPAMAFILAQPH